MGHVKHKYTREYFLKKDDAGTPTLYGVAGVDEFVKGDIRATDKAILRCLDFKGRNVLELGFGRGEAIKYALDNGATKVVGVDFSEYACDIAGDFLIRHGCSGGRYELHCQDALEFLRKNGRVRVKDDELFDIVLMLDFVEHIPRSELTEILKWMHGTLSVRAVVAVNTPIFKVDNDVMKEGLKPEAKDTSDECEQTRGMHCNRYTKESLINFMKDCGFQAISEGHFFITPLSIPIPSNDNRPEELWPHASKTGYPIQPSLEPEQFECAYSLLELFQQFQNDYQDLIEKHRALTLDHERICNEYAQLTREYAALEQSRDAVFIRRPTRFSLFRRWFYQR
jgi:2-polyprenyl-3-methyl-5-hydroxy-6-metoxy-1,4-benzoquinol methylase